MNLMKIYKTIASARAAFGDGKKSSPIFCNFCASIALILGCLFSGSVHAQLPEPAVSISVVIHTELREYTRATRGFGDFFLTSYVILDRDDPVSAERADVYAGLIRPDGVWMTWAEDPKPFGLWLPEVGVRPLIRNKELSGGSFILPGRDVGVLYHAFKSEDLPGIYQWFTLMVRAGKPADDVSQWISMRTKMFPVK